MGATIFRCRKVTAIMNRAATYFTGIKPPFRIYPAAGGHRAGRKGCRRGGAQPRYLADAPSRWAGLIKTPVPRLRPKRNRVAAMWRVWSDDRSNQSNAAPEERHDDHGRDRAAP